jgi:hypothetical protein
MISDGFNDRRERVSKSLLGTVTTTILIARAPNVANGLAHELDLDFCHALVGVWAAHDGEQRLRDCDAHRLPPGHPLGCAFANASSSRCLSAAVAASSSSPLKPADVTKATKIGVIGLPVSVEPHQVFGIDACL